jgi:hypothetical protein
MASLLGETYQVMEPLRPRTHERKWRSLEGARRLPELPISDHQAEPSGFHWQAVSFIRMQWPWLEGGMIRQRYGAQVKPMHVALVEEDLLLNYAAVMPTRLCTCPQLMSRAHCLVSLKRDSGMVSSATLHEAHAYAGEETRLSHTFAA